MRVLKVENEGLYDSVIGIFKKNPDLLQNFKLFSELKSKRHDDVSKHPPRTSGPRLNEIGLSKTRLPRRSSK